MSYLERKEITTIVHYLLGPRLASADIEVPPGYFLISYYLLFSFHLLFIFNWNLPYCQRNKFVTEVNIVNMAGLVIRYSVTTQR